MAVALLEVFTTLLLENKVFALYTWLIWLQDLDYSHFVQPVLSLVSLGCANKIYTVRSFISLEREPASMSRSPMQCTIQCNADAMMHAKEKTPSALESLPQSLYGKQKLLQ